MKECLCKIPHLKKKIKVLVQKTVKKIESKSLRLAPLMELCGGMKNVSIISSSGSPKTMIQ